MTDMDFTETDFLEFLRQGNIAGIMKPATARSRKLAAQQLFPKLEPTERMDLRLVDVDELCSRFHKLEDSTIRPETLKIYNERLKGALEDFFNWTEDPANFISVERDLPEAKLVMKRDSPGQRQAREELALNPPRSPHDIFPVPLREDLVVYLQNIPLDMTRQEAAKIAAVVKALALPDEEVNDE
ncbi:hypothetical protein [Pseudohalioglobus lutimaris]|uniref:Core-binding (CB) domain-containing protein n=1 Tax=Pseudohalioglobus lutimaris TaxID=1737061 RepID=A0A2N5X564_9GAMM|nr:hypothetical protein [Pseudohalioglobus lutimaris]PLW69621.1 hypothetical protein C0039_06320 [Pseudohalioglobus lutimaris]